MIVSALKQPHCRLSVNDLPLLLSFKQYYFLAQITTAEAVPKGSQNANDEWQAAIYCLAMVGKKSHMDGLLFPSPCMVLIHILQTSYLLWGILMPKSVHFAALYCKTIFRSSLFFRARLDFPPQKRALQRRTDTDANERSFFKRMKRIFNNNWGGTQRMETKNYSLLVNIETTARLLVCAWMNHTLSSIRSPVIQKWTSKGNLPKPIIIATQHHTWERRAAKPGLFLPATQYNIEHAAKSTNHSGLIISLWL